MIIILKNMLEMKKIFYRTVVAVCCGVLPFGCVKEDIASLGEQRNVTVQLNVGTRAVDATDGTPTNDESAIHTLRVYAFVGGKPAGHYFADNVTEALHTFFMDITFYSTGVQTVDFYAVANEAAMTGANQLSPNTTESQLKGLWFTGIQSNIQQYGLPMFCDKQSVEMDFTKVKPETPTAPGHEGHSWLDYDISFSLSRPMGKLGVFAAKSEGETGTLRVTGLTMLEEGTRARNYLMTPTPAQLNGIGNTTGNMALSVVDGAVDAELKAGDDRTDILKYTPVLDAPFYPFENPWGNGGDWSIRGEGGGEGKYGHALKIDYEFDGEARTGLVYLPVVERNHYYAICCLMHNDGKITVEYTVADWDEDPEGDYNIEFNYPQYTNPIQPENGSPLEGGNKYPQPTVSYDPNDNETSNYTFKFTITGPTNQKWTPTLVGDGLATKEHFQVKVYQVLSDGNKDYIYDNTVENPNNDRLVASPDPYYITVKALKPDNVDKEVGIGIAYDRSWSTEGSSLLLINGLTDELKWEGSKYAEVIIIKQVPLNQ